MEETNETEQTNQFNQFDTPPKVRPTFLTILCILTFIGSGYGIIDAITNYTAADTAGEMVELVDEQIDEEMDNDNMSDSEKRMVENLMGGFSESLTADNIRMMSILKIISCIMTLAGAILMWNLRKPGYYLYIAGIATLVIGYIAIFGGLVGAIAAGASGFFGVLFIILYGLNVKHMN